MDTFRIAATGHSLNYLPEYVAVEQGFFKDENLEVDAVVPNPWDLVLNEIHTNNSQAALGGIWVPAMYKNRGKDLVAFAKVSARCPLVIVGRKQKEFNFSDLETSTILVPGSNGASPGLFLDLLLIEHNVDKHKVNFIQNLSGSMLAELFVGGLGDYILIDPVTATRLTRQIDVHIVSPLAQTGGPIPWSVYYTEKGTSGDNPDMQIRFVRALNKGMQWILNNPTESLRPLLTRLFPKIEAEDSLSLIDRYKEWGMWDTPKIDEDACLRWQTGLVAGKVIMRPFDYHILVDGNIMNALYTEGVQVQN